MENRTKEETATVIISYVEEEWMFWNLNFSAFVFLANWIICCSWQEKIQTCQEQEVLDAIFT